MSANAVHGCRPSTTEHLAVPTSEDSQMRSLASGSTTRGQLAWGKASSAVCRVRRRGEIRSTSGAGDSLDVAVALAAACRRPNSVSWVSNLRGQSVILCRLPATARLRTRSMVGAKQG